MTQPPTYGPHNPHPLSTLRTELVWEGKYDEHGQRREVDVEVDGAVAHSSLLHGRKAGAFCHVDGIDSMFTRAEAKQVAQATARADGRECYCLLDFIDFWAIDFNWQPGKPFTHDWQDYRTRKDRSLRTISDAGYTYPAPGKYTACVKVVDTFGCDTSITVEVEV
ncbi:MAG: hypothetical protein ACKO24_06220 [Leptolyngbyaceae cyanobacterium]